MLRAIHCNDKPMVLVAPKGKSAPFEHAECLVEYLKDELPDCNVVDLSKIQAERVYDLLGLFDYAAILVSIDTMHLHLSRASKVPVAALVRDDVPWKGSPWRPSHVFHCRYSEFMVRAKELSEVCKRVVAGERLPDLRRIDGLTAHNYNPSVIKRADSLLVAYRWHPNPKDCRTKLALAEVDQKNGKIITNQPITLPEYYRHMSFEDPRLFTFNGHLHISYTVSRIPAKPAYCIVQYGRLVYEDGSLMIRDEQQPAFGRNDWTGQEKNFVFFEHEKDLFFLYQNSPVQTVVHALSGARFESEFPDWAWGDPHGGTTPLRYEDGLWIRFFHSRTMTGPKPWPWRYYMGAAIMEDRPPFKTVAISRHPILVGNEGYAKPYPFKPKVVFSGGAIALGGKYVVSVGVNDSESCLVSLDRNQLNL
jgi:predicted GH43/DUF377 family glycosyl hydrolase